MSALLFFQVRHSGACPSVTDTRGWGAWYGAPTSCSSERSICLVRSLLIVFPDWGWVFFGESVSLSLLSILMWFFNPFFCRAVHLVFRYFSEGNYPYATVDLLCLWEDRSSGSSCATILDPSPNPIYNLPIREPQAYMMSLENSPKQLRKILSILHKLFHVIEK